jgi:hypothetical protein
VSGPALSVAGGIQPWAVVGPASRRVLRARRYSRNGSTPRRRSTPTGLSPAPAARSSGLRSSVVDRAKALPDPQTRPSNPGAASPAGCAAAPVWAPPRSLAATGGILSRPPGTEMFQFPRCPPAVQVARRKAGRVAPFGHHRIPGRQRLPGAFRRVAASFLGRPRQGIPRAPFSAAMTARPNHRRLDRHAPGSLSDSERSRSSDPVVVSTPCRRSRSGQCRIARHLSSTQRTQPTGSSVTAAGPGRPARLVVKVRPTGRGGAAGGRTPDLRRARAALSRLSYGPLRSRPSSPAGQDPRGWARLDSNQGPRPYQGRALTA